ncbi:CHAT domain-containing protein [Microtetraspora sp. NBRC 13810]|uniref:CHAT domain-containing protein n=1 Tax=Microtetraspora sp. NBRC 13810 TaxID=3030990 RepID=UPI0025572710|nr:CHAT domain-containing protein [Microtetraspora sp. NBRC 13810]
MVAVDTPPFGPPAARAGQGHAAVVAAAEDAVVLCGVDPVRAGERAREVLALAERTACGEAAVIAHRALALAAREMGDLVLAEEHLRRAIADGGGLPRRVAQARLSLVSVRTGLGHPLEALEIADAAEPHLSETERAKLGAQRAVALGVLGRHREAIEQCDHAIAVLSTGIDIPATLRHPRSRPKPPPPTTAPPDRAPARTDAPGPDAPETDAPRTADSRTGPRADSGTDSGADDSWGDDAWADDSAVLERQLAEDLRPLAAAVRFGQEAARGTAAPGTRHRRKANRTRSGRRLPRDPGGTATGDARHAREADQTAANGTAADGTAADGTAAEETAPVDDTGGTACSASAGGPGEGAGRVRGGPIDLSGVVASGAVSADDVRFLTGALLNRGLAEVYLGEFERAEADLAVCAGVARAAGLAHVAVLAEANLPFAAARRGDIPAAFTRYRESEEALAGYPERLASMRCDLADALLAAYLPGEARALLDIAVPELEAAGARVALAEARLLLARLELLAGTPQQAADEAGRAAGDLAAQGRTALAPVATELVLRARLAVETPDRGLLDAMLSCAEALAAADRGAEAEALRLTCAGLAVRLEDPATAARHLRLLRGARSPVVRRHAAALRHLLAGDRDRALRAARRGLAEVAASVAAVRDPLIRAHAVKAGDGLAAFGLSLAIGTGRGRTTLAWAERWRSVAATGRPGHPDPDLLRAAIGEGALVEYVRDGDELAAVVVTAGRVTLHRLGSVAVAAEAVIRLRYALRRAGLRDTAHHCDGGGREEVERAALAVEELLVRPLRWPPAEDATTPTGLPQDEAAGLFRHEATAGPPPGGARAVPAGSMPGGAKAVQAGSAAGVAGGGAVVVVPTGPLHTLPWPVLPSLRDRPVCVSAGALAWLSAVRRWERPPARPPRVMVTAGPGLEHATAEARIVAGRYPGTRTAPARVEAVLSALDDADVAHLAAHGTFHARSPLLSTIALDDGPLMAYDLLRLRTPPRLVVLSACDSGMARAPADGAPLGLAGMFLAMGTACVVAGTVPVRDDETPALMTIFHELLCRGHTPARALAEAAGKTGVAGFVCFGAGDLPVIPGR